jgi:histidinol phosphatase-like enzyme (inositol monophosphatase family)
MDQKFLDFSNFLADKAGIIASKNFRAQLLWQQKNDSSPVTNVDIAIEKALYESLSNTYPEHGFLGEELGEFSKDSPYQWIIDPIDGTSSFISGKPLFSILMSLLYEGIPVLGIIDQPITGERWVGQKGKPTEFNSKPCSTHFQKGQPLRLACTSPFMFDEKHMKTFEKMVVFADSTSFGGDAYNYGLLALGHIDLILESDLKFYDVAALIPVVEGAGGLITNWKGETISKDTFNGQALASSNRALHSFLLEKING